MTKKIEDLVVVITGASSGIGRATALELARRGANVVVAARREQLLQQLARECNLLSDHEAIAIPTNVADETAVEELARQTIEHFGRIDVWVNNAGVLALGFFEELPPDVFRQVIETNFFGEVHGSRAALKQFLKQGHGTLINIASMMAEMGGPYYSAYVASKFAIRGFSECLRTEIELQKAHNVHVCTVMPATIDTPIFEHAANYSVRAIQPLPPVYPVEEVAKTILRCIEKPQNEVFAGSAARVFDSLHSLAPNMTDSLMARQVDRMDFKDDEPATPTSGNLFAPMEVGTGITGGWHGEERTQVRRVISAVSAGAAALGSGLAAWAWLRHRANAQTFSSGLHE